MVRKKHIIFITLVGMAALAILSGCAPEYTVEFNDGAVQNVQTVKSGSRLTEPEVQNRKDYDFIGWFSDSEYGKKWDFAQDKVKDNLTLYAAWDRNSDDEFSG